MKTKQKLLIFTLLTILLHLASYGATYSQIKDPTLYIRNATIKILNTSIEPSYYIPWKMKKLKNVIGSGAIIQGNRILTNAHVVSNSTFLQVQKENDPESYNAEILFIDHKCDLAVLTVKKKKFFNNTTALNFGGIPKLRSKVITFGYPAGGERISITVGVVSRIEMGTYAHSADSKFLMIQTDAAINSGNSGGPVIQDWKIVGVAFQARIGASNIGYMIPVPIIKRFLKDIEDGKNESFGSLGILTDTLLNKNYRSYLKMTNVQTGIMVKHVIKNSSSYKRLLSNDVLLKVEDVPIANDGSIPFGDGRIMFYHLVDTKQIGDNVTINLLRNGEEKIVKLKLKKLPMRIPWSNDFDVLPRYYIFGGIVFQPLNKNYLKSWKKWWINGNLKMLYYYFYYIEDNPHPERKEFVVINNILPDTSNTYISNIKDKVINRINGIKILKLADIKKAFEKPVGKYHIIEMDDIYTPIVLKVSEMEKANIRIKKKYKIHSLHRLHKKNF